MSDIDTIILKCASPCNLKCTYCYEYASGDESWRSKPTLLGLDVAAKLGERIREYVLAHPGRQINVVAHGGEPLLMGPKALDATFSALCDSAGPGAIILHLQTNGLLINADVCDVLRRWNVRVGVSVDGGEAHNVRRVDRRGRETFKAVMQGISCLRANAPDSFYGVLCVVDFMQEPEDVMKSLFDMKPRIVDLLQPFVTHDMLIGGDGQGVSRFGSWMTRAVQYWFERPQYHEVRVRFIEDAMKAALGHQPKSDWFGRRRVTYLIVESDGAYDLQDQLKVTGAESANIRSLGRGVFNLSLEEAGLEAERLLAEVGGDCLPAGCA